MYRPFAIALLAALSLAAQVPPSYQQTYDYLSTQISAFDTAAKAGYDGTPYPYLSSPQVLRASSDLFTNLLASSYYEQTVTPELNEFQALGARAVDVHINFPILYQPYYNSISNPSQYQEFVSFYQQLAQDVHARGMKLIVESVVGAVVPGTQVSTFQPYFSSLSWAGYMNGRAQNALNVAQLIQPDYMTVITEPDTEASTSGQTEVGTITGATQLLQTIMTTIRGAKVKDVAVGAGTGTWLTSYTSWVSNFLSQPISFLDMHIIPCNNDDLTVAITGAQMAHAAGRGVGVSEAWAAKVMSSEGGVTTASLDALNPFSFWAPIDTAFLQAIADFANADQLTYIAPSWTTYFFAYLDYATYGSLPPDTVLNDAYSASATAVNQGAFTSTAVAWENATIAAPDTTPPVTPAPPVAGALGFTNVVLNWVPTADNVGVAGYRVYRNGLLVASINGLTYYDTTLSSGKSYSYSLVAFDAAGNSSAHSATLTVTTISNIPPSVPTNVKVTAVTSSSVSLSWSASSGHPANYRVLKGTSPTSLANHAVVTGTSYTDTHVSPKSTYYYEIESVNANGFSSAPSAEVSATTPSAQ